MVVAAAAVADYRPAHPVSGKMRRTEDPLTLELVPNPDIVAALAKENPSARVIGFAAEPDGGLDVVRQKIERKGLFAIAANDIGNPDIGFESDQNELHLLWKAGAVETSGRQSKLGCALWLLEKVAPAGPGNV
jgi:phosphopantothenoylcysteine decarboxylase/phosphopantothenate--cysteine ligase